MTPTEIRFKAQSQLLCIEFESQQFELDAEYLRVFSPSAEVRGHGLALPILVSGKRQVKILKLEPVGQYAIRLVFDDGHDSGLYTWSCLYQLGQEQQANWQQYLQRLQQAGLSR